MARKLRIAKSYFVPRADKGEGGTFAVEDGQLVWFGDNINILGDMGCGS